MPLRAGPPAGPSPTESNRDVYEDEPAASRRVRTSGAGFSIFLYDFEKAGRK